MKNWYIVQSHSSFENKVASLINEEAEKAKISDKIEEIVIPTHDVTEIKKGKRIQAKKFYLSYTLGRNQAIRKIKIFKKLMIKKSYVHTVLLSTIFIYIVRFFGLGQSH